MLKGWRNEMHGDLECFYGWTSENLESVDLGCDLTVGRAEALLTGSPKSFPLVSAPFSPPPVHSLPATEFSTRILWRKTYNMKCTVLTLLSVHVSNVKSSHIVVWSISRTLSSCKTETLSPLNSNLLWPFTQPVATTILCSVCMNLLF